MTSPHPINEARDKRFMARAIEIAAAGRFWASPNPHVGCVLVADNEEIASGFTQPPGSHHAEIEALKVAGDRARGATAYVTLEPCAHWGRTGPCAHALVDAGVARVVAAIEDPFGAVAGRGLQILRDAGVQVTTGVLADEARALIAGFLLRVERGWGRVRLKLACSLDGRTAMASGESQWITGAAARADVQRLRAESSVILTGIGTVLADDCALTVREEQLPLRGDELGRALMRAPLRAVLDSELRTPSNAKVVNGAADTVLFHGGGAGGGGVHRTQAAVEYCQVPKDATGLDLVAVLQDLGARGANEILVEAGATLASAMLGQQLVDEVIIYQAPRLLGATGRPLVNSNFASLADTPAFRLLDVSRVGDDLRITAAPV